MTDEANNSEPRDDAETHPEAAPPNDAGSGEATHRLSALIPDDGRQPPASVSDSASMAVWASVSALWHPALLARVDALPRIEPVEDPSPPERGDVRIVPLGAIDRLVSGYRTQADDAGAVVLEGGTDRPSLILEILERLEPGASLDDRGPDAEEIALDFLALGTARWMLRDLTIGMGHADCLDIESLERETLSGARSWQEGDFPGAKNRLRAAFELLTQARERFYPVDAYLIDLYLLDTSTPVGALVEALKTRAPFTILAPAKGIESFAKADPEAIATVREAITEGWADVVGGPFDEQDEPLLPVESILWQYRHGSEVYQTHLDGRNVETVARRRFALYPMLPQVARRFGMRFGLHLGFDQGKYPIPSEAKRLWESPDGASLECLTRPPLAADQQSDGLRLPWRLSQSMKDDHVATVPLVHWPSPVAGWYVDLRRTATYSPVLARWVTLSDYFHLTDRPWDIYRPSLDEYVTPYLEQAAARKESSPISKRAEHARLRARFDALLWMDAILQSLKPRPTATEPGDTSPSEEGPASPPRSVALSGRAEGLEKSLESGVLDALKSEIELLEASLPSELSQWVVGQGNTGRPGYLVFNPVAVPRRAAVLLPDAAADLRPEGPLRAAQFTEEGVWAVVDLASHGFAWVPKESNFDREPAPTGSVGVSGRTLRNESMEVEIDEATGGIRSIQGPGESVARLGQQLVIVGLTSPDNQPVVSTMRATEFEVDYGGPALAQAVSRGQIVDASSGRPYARFEQRFRLWTGRPTLELTIRLSEIDEYWLKRLASLNPWNHFLACRWAWPDASSTLRRCSLLGPETTDADRPETPDVLDISTRRQRTAILFGGLAHHRRHGRRMLDTLLVTGGEVCREFKLGVALDLEFPFHAALDFIAPPVVTPTNAGPPRNGPAGWFFHVDHRSVAVTRVEFHDSSGDGRGWGLVFHLLETAGRAARCRIRLFRDPTWARQTDFQGDLIVDLPIEGDAVLVDLTPRELARVDVTLGGL